MKKWILTLSFLWVLVLSGCWWSSNLVEYSDTFVALVKECTDSTQTLFETFQAEWTTLDWISQSLQDCIDICQNSQKKASDMWDYDKDSSLKDAVVDLLSTEVEYLEKFAATRQYRNIDDITDEDRQEYESVVNDLYQSEELLNSKFVSLQETQESFAAKHGLNIE